MTSKSLKTISVQSLSTTIKDFLWTQKLPDPGAPDFDPEIRPVSDESGTEDDAWLQMQPSSQLHPKKRKDFTGKKSRNTPIQASIRM